MSLNIKKWLRLSAVATVLLLVPRRSSRKAAYVDKTKDKSPLDGTNDADNRFTDSHKANNDKNVKSNAE